MGVFVRHEACAECGSSDGKAIYDDDSHYCWVCADTSLSDDILEEFKKKNKPKVRRSSKTDERTPRKETMKPFVTEEENTKLKEQTQLAGLNYRGISDETLKFFGVRTKVENGKVAAVYYPCTVDGDLSGYKPRLHPKTFGGSIGVTGTECDLFGQFRFRNNPNNSKFCLIVGGEHDQLAAYQMLSKYFKSKGWEFEPVVVSPTIGETGSAKQLSKQYEFFNQFEKIIIGFDNDDAGREATEKAIKVLPKGKVFVATWSSKDPNKMLEDGKQKEFLNNYYDAKQYVPVGVLGSNQISAEMRTEFDIEKIPLPPFMHKLQDMMAGGIPLGRIVNLGSASGCVDKDTEYLTPSGWKKFDDYDGDELVAQYNQDGTISFVKPKEYVKLPCEVMTRISNRSTDQVLSDEHRFVYFATENSKTPIIKPFSEVKDIHQKNKTGFRGLIKTVFNYSGSGIDMSEGELRLQVAVMADGRIVKEGANNYTQMRFNKQRKYDRLIAMCNKFDIIYRDDGVDQNGYFNVIVWPKTNEKQFTERYYNCSKEQFKIICDEVMHWDGYLKNNTYTSTRKGDVDFLQFAFACIGKRSVVCEDSRTDKYKEGYCGVLNVNKNSQFVSFRAVNGNKPEMKPYKTLDGFKYCFMVDSGMLVLRRNGRIFITGNTGKSTIIDEVIYYIIFNSPHKVGVVTLEATSGQYGIKLLSRHIGKKLELLPNEEAKELLESEYVLQKEYELFNLPDGSPRFYLVDDRDGDVEDIQSAIENLIIGAGCKVILLDPIHDIISALPNEEQDNFTAWQKGMVKSHNVTFLNVCHTRKTSSGQKAGSAGADLHEEDIQGSSALYKSAACNLMFSRDKESEDYIVRNTIIMKATKIRWTGKTGIAGRYFYEIETHTMWDLDDYLNTHGIVQEGREFGSD